MIRPIGPNLEEERVHPLEAAHIRQVALIDELIGRAQRTHFRWRRSRGRLPLGFVEPSGLSGFVKPGL